MSCIRITTCQLARSPPAFPAKDFQLKKSLSAYLGTRLPKISLKSTQATSQAAIVCLFGDKGKSENENQASPWNVLAVGNFKKDQSFEDVLKQQIQKQEYYDGGDGGGKSPGGGGEGSGDGSDEGEDEGLFGVLGVFEQVILATIGFLVFLVFSLLEDFNSSFSQTLSLGFVIIIILLLVLFFGCAFVFFK